MPKRTPPTVPVPIVPDLERFAGDVAKLPADPDLARLADELAAAHAALVAEQDRAAALRRRRVAIAGALPDAIGTDRTALLQDLLVVEADEGTVPAGVAGATRRYVFARLGFLRRVIEVAEAEAARLVAATDGPITEVGRAQLKLAQAEGYTGAAPRSPDVIAELRADLERRQAELRPDAERHAWAKGVAGLARATVESAYGPDVVGFGGGDRALLSWGTIAERAGEAAAERVRRGEQLGRAA